MGKTATHEGHERPKALRDPQRKRRGNYPVKGTVMEVVREALNRTPGRVREVVVAEEGAVQMSPFPVEAEAPGQLRGDPHIHKASAPDEEPALRLQRLRADHKVGELNLGNPAQLVEAGHGRLLRASKILSRSASRWSKAKKSSNPSASRIFPC